MTALSTDWSNTTPGGIAYSEVDGSPTFSFNTDGASAQRVFQIEWEDRDAFVEEAFPQTQLSATGWNSYSPITFPNKSFLYLDSLQIAPFDPDNPYPNAADDHNAYPTAGARVTANYSSRQYQNGTLPDGTQVLWNLRSTIGAELLRLPQHGYQWASVPNVTVQNEDLLITKIVPTIEHQLSVFNIINPPLRSRFYPLVGTVNDDDFDWFPSTTPGVTATVKRGCMMFQGMDSELKTLATGQAVYDLTYRLTERAIQSPVLIAQPAVLNITAFTGASWNHFWRDEPGGWDVIEDKSSNMVYAEDDFEKLFTFA